MKPYKTIAKYASDEYIVQKSRFIGNVAPADTEDSAKEFVNAIKTKYKDARHNCYAYIINKNYDIMHYSDDGEPSGTAGIPMLEVLKQCGLVNCVVVVTRYFGGILLGAGGLIRAYRNTCLLGVKAAGIVVMQPSQNVSITVGYALWSKLEYHLNNMPLIIESVNYGAEVLICILIKDDDYIEFYDNLNKITEGKFSISSKKSLYYPWNAKIDNEVN